MTNVPDAPGRDETFPEQLARLCNPPAPALDKLEQFAKTWEQIDREEEELALERRRLADQDELREIEHRTEDEE